MVEQTTRRGDDDIGALAQTTLLALALLSAADHRRNDPEEGQQQLLDGLLDLDAQLARGHQDNRVRAIAALDLRSDALEALDDGNEVGQRLAGARLRFDHHIASLADEGDGGGLDDRRVCEVEHVGTLQHLHLVLTLESRNYQFGSDMHVLKRRHRKHRLAGHQLQGICETRVLNALVGHRLRGMFARACV